MTRIAMLVVGLALAGSPAQAKAPRLCTAAPRVTLTPLPDEEGLTRFEASPHGEYRETEAIEKWAADLNGDGLTDRAVFYVGTCGNYGECVTGVYVGCGNDEYAIVLEPDYHYQLELTKTKTKVKGRSWRDLVLTERTERSTLAPIRLVFDGKQYRPARR